MKNVFLLIRIGLISVFSVQQNEGLLSWVRRATKIARSGKIGSIIALDENGRKTSKAKQRKLV